MDDFFSDFSEDDCLRLSPSMRRREITVIQKGPTMYMVDILSLVILRSLCALRGSEKIRLQTIYETFLARIFSFSLLNLAIDDPA